MADANNDQINKPGPAETAPDDAQETRVPITRKNSSDEERPPSAQRAPGAIQEPSEGEEESEEDIDPADKIDDFDWDELHERYHNAMSNASTQEAGLLNEFTQLMDYFKVWADAGHNHESDRTFHRLRTRMAYVDNSEQKLEKTRQHYIEVVRAFESALALLKGNGFGG